MITVLTTPDANHGAFNPVLYTFSSSRYQQVTYSGLTPTNSGGYVMFTQGGHAMVVGDVVSLSGFSAGDMNDDYKVTAITATTFTTDLAWDASYAVAGDVQRNNQNLVILMSVKVLAATYAEKIVKQVGAIFTADIAQILQSLVTEDEIDTAGAYVQSPTPASSMVTYTIDIQERWTDKYGNPETDTLQSITTIGGDPIVAFNMALNDDETFDDFVLDGTTKRFLAQQIEPLFSPDDTYQLHFMTAEATVYLRVAYVTPTSSVMNTYGLFIINNKRGMVLVDSTLFPSDAIFLEISIEDSAHTVISEIFTFMINRNCVNGRWVEWKNQLGGFDSYRFPDYESAINSKPTNYKTPAYRTAFVKNERQEKLKTAYIDNDGLKHIKGLLLSRKVTADNKDVVVIDNKMIYDSRNAQQVEVTIQRNDEISS